MPDKVHLNTVVRPPAEKCARALSREKLEEIRKHFGETCEIIANFAKKRQVPLSSRIQESIISLIRRRPATVNDMAASLGVHPDEIRKHLDLLLERGKVRALDHKGQIFYEPG
jgi:wyosine [tRNA(Phe)-imidazoG37] synthetase (radical SAM superfamily)